MRVRQPRWLYAGCVSNLLGFASFAAAVVTGQRMADLIVLGLGFAAAGLYMLAVSMSRPRNKERGS